MTTDIGSKIWPCNAPALIIVQLWSYIYDIGSRWGRYDTILFVWLMSILKDMWSLVTGPLNRNICHRNIIIAQLLSNMFPLRTYVSYKLFENRDMPSTSDRLRGPSITPSITVQNRPLCPLEHIAFWSQASTWMNSRKEMHSLELENAAVIFVADGCGSTEMFVSLMSLTRFWTVRVSNNTACKTAVLRNEAAFLFYL